MEQKFNLNRFVNAQNSGMYGATYERALSEIKAGAKYSHWIWYVFPQIKGIPGAGSGNASLFAFSSADEAKAYWQHEILGPRLREIVGELLRHKDKDVISIMGSHVDMLKLRSSMTIFYYATQEPIFKQVIDTFYHGIFDQLTTSIMSHRV